MGCLCAANCQVVDSLTFNIMQDADPVTISSDPIMVPADSWLVEIGEWRLCEIQWFIGQADGVTPRTPYQCPHHCLAHNPSTLLKGYHPALSEQCKTSVNLTII